MFRSEERHGHGAFFPFGNPFKIKKSKRFSSPNFQSLLRNFEESIDRILRMLKNAGDIRSLSWMNRAMESLSSIHSDARILTAELEFPVTDWDDQWIDVYLSNSMNILDICNTLTSEISRINAANLSIQFAVNSIRQSNLSRAKDSLDAWKRYVSSENPRFVSSYAVVGSLKKSLGLLKSKNSTKPKILMRAMYGVIASTILILSVLVSSLSCSSSSESLELEIPEAFLWREAFADLQARVSAEPPSGRRPEEIASVDRTVARLCPTVQVDPPCYIVTSLIEDSGTLSKGVSLLSGSVSVFFGIILNGRDVLLSKSNLDADVSKCYSGARLL